MLGGGHIAEMVARMKQNREMLKNKRFFKRQIKSQDFDFSKHIEHKLNYKIATKNQLQKIRNESKEESRRMFRKRLLILFVSLIITFIAVLSIYYFINKFGMSH